MALVLSREFTKWSILYDIITGDIMGRLDMYVYVYIIYIYIYVIYGDTLDNQQYDLRSV